MRPSSIRFFKASPLLLILTTTFLNSCVTPQPPQTSVSAIPFIEDKPSIDVCFSPEGNCQPIILNLINYAKSEIRVQSYSFTSRALAEALINAHHRGVNVKILFDRSQVTARYSQIRRMREAGIECIVDPVPGIAHNKIMIIDNEIILTGSYNWTTAAEIRNAENLLIIKNKPTVNIYKRNWERRYERAQGLPYKEAFYPKLKVLKN